METLLNAKCGYELGGYDLYCVCFNDINSLTCSPKTLVANSCDAYKVLCKNYCHSSGFETVLDVCGFGTGNDGITIPDALPSNFYDTLMNRFSNNSFPSPTSSGSPVSSSAPVPSTSTVVSSTPKEQSSSQLNVNLSSMMILLMLVFSSLYINTN